MQDKIRQQEEPEPEPELEETASAGSDGGSLLASVPEPEPPVWGAVSEAELQEISSVSMKVYHFSA